MIVIPVPGHNVYSNGVISDSADIKEKLLNSAGLQFALHAKGHEFIQIAQAIFNAESVHDPEDLTPTYNESWEIRDIHRLLVKAIQVWNTDPTAEWVEFGAHAGGKTRVLRYRVMGRTADILEAIAHE